MKTLDQLLEEADKNKNDKDIAKITEYISEVKEIAEKTENHNEKSRLYYSIGTAYDDILTINFKDLTDNEKEENYENQILYYRKALQCKPYEEKFEWCRLDEFNNYGSFVEDFFKENNITVRERNRTTTLLCNLGKCFLNVGRYSDAIYSFKKAFTYSCGYPMAMGNIGVAESEYAEFWSVGYYLALKKLAYVDLMYVTEDKDSVSFLKGNNLSHALEYFEKVRNDIISEFNGDKNLLKSPLESDSTYGNEEDEVNYNTWVAAKGLFLNPLNDCTHDVAGTRDTLNLPSIFFEDGDHFKKLLGLFNQIKQEYVSSRYLFYLASEHITSAHFSDKHTYIIDTQDYSKESIYDYLLRNCFKSFSSIFDRIAFFINQYFDLGIKNRDVSFRSIWDNEKRGRNSYQFKNNLIEVSRTNSSLVGLYWLSKDIIESNYKTITPEKFDYKDFRNHLEHKYVKTVCQNRNVNNRKDDTVFYITEKELYKVTIEMMRLARSAIITLISAVGINENKKLLEISRKGMGFKSVTLNIVEDENKL